MYLGGLSLYVECSNLNTSNGLALRVLSREEIATRLTLIDTRRGTTPELVGWVDWWGISRPKKDNYVSVRLGLCTYVLPPSWAFSHPWMINCNL